MSEEKSDNICNFCSSKSLYTCPQCNAQYCSSNCYKCSKHLKCSEKFYKGMVEEQLKGSNASEESKKKMQDILLRLHNDDFMGEKDELLDSDDDDDLVERLKGINLDDSDSVWASLEESEKEEFLELLKNGKTTDLIPPWKAWWDTNSVVTELKDGDAKDIPPFVEDCPTIVECPLLSKVMKNEPSPCIPFNILNVLASYVWTVRLFNGDHQESCVDATEAILTLSPTLSAATNYSSSEIAVNTPKMEAQNHSWLRESEEFNSSVLEDLKTILKGPNPNFRTFFIAAALSDLHSLLSTCKIALVPKKRKEHRGLFTSSLVNVNQEITKVHAKTDTVKNCIKKIEFFLSFVKEYPCKLCIEI